MNRCFRRLAVCAVYFQYNMRAAGAAAMEPQVIRLRVFGRKHIVVFTAFSRKHLKPAFNREDAKRWKVFFFLRRSISEKLQMRCVRPMKFPECLA